MPKYPKGALQICVKADEKLPSMRDQMQKGFPSERDTKKFRDEAMHLTGDVELREVRSRDRQSSGESLAVRGLDSAHQGGAEAGGKRWWSRSTFP